MLLQSESNAVGCGVPGTGAGSGRGTGAGFGSGNGTGSGGFGFGVRVIEMILRIYLQLRGQRACMSRLHLPIPSRVAA